MIHCELQKITPEMVAQAEQSVDDASLSILKKKATYEHSLIGRFLISRYLESKGISYFPSEYDSNEQKKIGIYRSLSHSHEMVMIGVSDLPIGVDIEFGKPKSKKLYREILGESEGEENWEMFYLRWTMMEAVMKRTGWGMGSYHELSFDSSISNRHLVGSVEFSLLTQAVGRDSVFGVRAGELVGYTFSISASHLEDLVK